MPRTKPTTKLGVYGKYDINPEQAATLYVESKAQNKYYIKQPYWDIAREGIEGTAIQKDREFDETIKIQDEMREKSKIDAHINEKRIEEMHKIQQNLREQFITANDFIRDCEDKEHQAEDKMAVEKKLHQQMEQEIEQKQKSIEILSEFYEELRQTADEFEPYETVINQVVAESELYKNVKDLIDRSDALMIAQVEINEMEQEKIKIIEDLRIRMVKALNEAALNVMGLNNELAELERCYDTAKAESLRWEKILAATKDVIADKETVTFRLLDQIQQIYGLFCKRSGEAPAFHRHQVEEMFDYIKEEMEYMSDVLKASKEIMANERKSKIAQKGSTKSQSGKKK